MESLAITWDWQSWLPALQSPLGAVAFVPLYALWVTLLLPGVWASMLAGALYGPWWGSLVVFVGACLGAEAAFLLGRTWLRQWARRRLSALPKLQAVEQAVSREGLKLMLLTRLSPAFPFCGLGALAGDVARFGEVLSGQADAGTWALRIVGLLATVASVWVAGRAARRALTPPDGPCP
jgi:hypothetical protein